MKQEFSIYDREVNQTISFVKVALERDAGLLHKWHQEPHVSPFWNLNIPFEKYRIHLEGFLADTHQMLFLGLMDGVPMSYWEAYWVKGDVVGSCYDPHPEDRGIHLLIGEPDYLGKGYALPLLRAMVLFQFLHQGTDKIIAEPDIRNKKMIHIFEQCGFKKIKPIELADKTGMLMFCERKQFERRWKDVSAAAESL